MIGKINAVATVRVREANAQAIRSCRVDSLAIANFLAVSRVPVELQSSEARMARSAIVVIGASAGGVSALQGLVGGLPAAFSAPVVIVLHIGAHKSSLPALLTAAGPIPATYAEDGETIGPGRIYVAPPDRHLTVVEGRVHLSRGPKENCARPAIDPLFRSAAENYGSNVIGVILTGNLNDGTLGLEEIKQHGGLTVVQDPEDAAHPDMPKSAAGHVSLDYCLPLADIPNLLIKLVNGTDGKAVVMPITPSQPRAAEKLAISGGRTFERPLTVTCPDCGGALKRREVGSIVKFDCHVGHTYTAEVMASAQFEELEKVMRAAVRFLNERAEFCLQMAEHSQSGEANIASDWHAASKQALDRAYKLRDLVEQDWITPEAGRITSAHIGLDLAAVRE